MNLLNYKRAFTLSEVLIALVVIGVVAAITMMTIVPTVHEAQTVSQVKHAFSTFSNAYTKVKTFEGVPEDWDLGTEDSQYGAARLYEYFKPHMVRVKDCDTNSGCFADGDYTAMDGKTVWAWNPRLHQKYARGVLSDGTAFAFWSGGNGCTASGQANKNEGGIYSKVCGAIHIDINGHKKPNRAGYDFFTLNITPNGIYPTGLDGYKSTYGDDCKFGSNKNTNGNTCIGWILAKGNLDYQHRDVTGELH